jgi:hypothetical protein
MGESAKNVDRIQPVGRKTVGIDPDLRNTLPGSVHATLGHMGHTLHLTPEARRELAEIPYGQAVAVKHNPHVRQASGIDSKQSGHVGSGDSTATTARSRERGVSSIRIH